MSSWPLLGLATPVLPLWPCPPAERAPPPPRSASRSPAPVSRMRHAPRLDRSAGRPSAPRPRPPQRDGGVAQPRSRSRPPAARPSPAIERQGSLPSVPRKPASARPRLAIERPAPLALDHAPAGLPRLARQPYAARPSPPSSLKGLCCAASRASGHGSPGRAPPSSLTELRCAAARPSAHVRPRLSRRRAPQGCAGPPLARLPMSASPRAADEPHRGCAPATFTNPNVCLSARRPYTIPPIPRNYLHLK